MLAQVRGGYSPTLTPITSTPSQWTPTRSVVTTAAALLLAGARRVTVTRAVIITQHIAHHKNITGLAFCHRYRRTVHECCREEAVYKCSAYIIYVNNVLCRRRICLRTTCGSICGTWRSRTSPSTSWTSSPPTWRSSRRSSPPPSSTPRSAISSSTAPAKEPSDCVTWDR